MTIKVKWHFDDGVKISRGTKESVGIDIHVPRDTIIRPGLNKIGLGIRTAIQPGYWALISLEKSGVGVKKITCAAGVIDSDYRGEWVALIYNNSDEDIMFKAGSKIVQVVFLPCIKVESETVVNEDQLERTERTGGFGSTGNS